MRGIRHWLAGRSSARPTTPRALPPGTDEVRRLDTPAADRLAELAGLLAALDQAIEAMRLLVGRQSQATPSDLLIDLALLRFAMVQFTAAFKARRGSVRLTPRQAFGAEGAGFFDYVAAFTDQLTGDHARVVGQVETVVLLKRAADRAGVLGLATRTRRPERLTATELTNLADFMARGRDAYAEAHDRVRAELAAEVEAMDTPALLSLPLQDSH